VIANRNTTVPAIKTVGEIQMMLAAIRADAIVINYENGEPSAIAFRLIREGQSISFRLPSNWQGILQALKRDKKIPKRLLTADQAKRVSWRVLRDWLRAQLSLIEAGASTIEEVMLPWAITDDGTTVSSRILSGQAGLLAFNGKSN
jgi:hypothetical protein